MIDINNYEKIAEYVDGCMKWLSGKKGNIVYLMMFGQDSYVGSTKNAHSRFRQCLSALRRGKYDISKVQEAFDVTRGFSLYLIEKTSEECLRQREKYWIDELKPTLNTHHLSIGQTMKVYIKEVMAERGMKSVELAERLGVTKQTVSNLINGRVMPSVETISKAADALGVPMWRLFASREDVASYLDMPTAARDGSPVICCPNCGHEIKIKIE